MTHIVDPTRFKTKKSFKEAVAADPATVYLADPSIIDALSGPVDKLLKYRRLITVTNHPKRSWFASIEMKNDKIVVK